MERAGTGLTAAQCEREGLRYDYAYVIPQDKVSLMPDSRPLHVKLIFEVPTGRVLGAQAIGQGDAAKRIDVVATAIKFGAVVDDLRDLELCYAPPFSNAKDPVNVAALVAGNLLGGDYRQTMWTRRAHSWNPGRRSSTCANPVPSPRAISRALSISRSRRCARGWTRSPPTGRCT